MTAPMRVAIVHYHLAKGGVTRVIQSALRALRGSDCEALVLSSARPEESLEPVAIVPELAYAERASVESADRLEQGLLKAARMAFGREPDLWHFHNHGLGKNANLPEVVRRFAMQGKRLVLQIHDFAEDGRPGNFLVRNAPYRDGTFTDAGTALYPVAPQIVYAVLNRRDQTLLHEAGIPREQVRWLPNAVSLPEEDAPATGPDRPGRLVLYPTRGIRRKNLGELLLMAALCPDFRYATTLAPRNPQWAGIHRHWEALIKTLDLPVELALCDRSSAAFEPLVRSAHVLVTTSIAEGFGLAFLEPSLLGKALVGRDLPEITADFRDNGVALPGLYTEWPVPLSLLNGPALRDRTCRAMRALNQAYGRTQQPAEALAAWHQFTRHGEIDFGCLDEAAQTEVIEAVHRGQPHRIGLPFGLEKPAATPIRENRARINALYGLSPYRDALRALYEGILRAAPASPTGADPERILDGFLQPNRFRLLRA